MSDHEEAQPVRAAGSAFGLFRGTCSRCGQTVEAVQLVEATPSMGGRHRAPCRSCANPAALAALDIGAGVEARFVALVDLDLVKATVLPPD